jgi:hypothetical protein
MEQIAGTAQTQGSTPGTLLKYWQVSPPAQTNSALGQQGPPFGTLPERSHVYCPLRKSPSLQMRLSSQ